jgi:hypothetical protein
LIREFTLIAFHLLSFANANLAATIHEHRPAARKDYEFRIALADVEKINRQLSVRLFDRRLDYRDEGSAQSERAHQNQADSAKRRRGN